MDKQITGMMVYYDVVCKRKLWYFYHQIQMEQDNENVQIGKLLDEESYERDEKHIHIDDVINIDFIRAEGILHEVKKSRKIEEASLLQVKYYLYYLKQRGIKNIRGKIDYPLLKKSIDVILEPKDEIYLKEVLMEIKSIVAQEKPPAVPKTKICTSCAYFDLCYI